MAIVSLKSQQITIYDAEGWILRAPVSSGQKGRETPAGVFSVIQKERDHYSNLYDDAYMPNMQRLTWSGIALHGGPLPGYAASHGCVRMPYGFAERLFDETSLGMRVIIAPRDTAPVAIIHPALPASKEDPAPHAAALAAQFQAAARKADEAALAAATAAREAARARTALRVLDNLKARAETQLASADAAFAALPADADKTQATEAKAAAAAKVAELDGQWTAANSELQAKLDAVTQARAVVSLATAARTAAGQAAHDAARALEPLSVFVSRKTQRLYVRRGFEPLFDAPITIRNPEQPIGTHVFTAVARSGDGLSWTAVAVNDAADAKSALERLVVPQDVVDRIGPSVPLRSSVIISDEPVSAETGKGTEFVAVLSNEPQGGLSMRHHAPAEARYVRQREEPYSYSYSWGGRRFGYPFSDW